MKRSLPLILALTATTAMAEVPSVATDIAPVHGLAAKVMQGVGAPHLIVPPSASPHDFALRPSQARALQDADLVIWIGPDLTPWLDRTLDSLSDATTLELNAMPGTQLKGWRDLEAFGDAHDEDGHDEHAHDDDHDEEHAHDDHAHEHGANDPHTWLDPENAKTWADAIAAELARQDPENAAIYQQNATAAKAGIDAASAQAAERLAPHQETPFLVMHDAYQYFDSHFDLNAAAYIADSDGVMPGPGHVRDLQAMITDQGIACLFAEPQFETGLIETLAEGTDARVAVLDPLGTALEPGADFYPALLGAMAEAMAECFEGQEEAQ